MAIGSPPITWNLKHTGEPWVCIGTPLPNPSGNTGVMVCYVMLCSYYVRPRFPLRYEFCWSAYESVCSSRDSGVIRHVLRMPMEEADGPWLWLSIDICNTSRTQSWSVSCACNYTGTHALKTRTPAALLCGTNRHSGSTSPDELLHKELYYYGCSWSQLHTVFQRVSMTDDDAKELDVWDLSES